MKKKMKVQFIREYFTELHNSVGQSYGTINDIKLPYSFHLDSVYKFGEKFKHLILNNLTEEQLGISQFNLNVGLYGHDSIEDCRVSYNDMLEKFGVEAAEIIFLCTEYTGRTRAERKPPTFYENLSKNRMAKYVKLCDIMANSTFSLSQNSTMFKKYKREYFEKVRPLLYCDDLYEMFKFLDNLYGVE